MKMIILLKIVSMKWKKFIKFFNKKTLIEDGKEQKQGVIDKLICKRKSFIFIPNCYLTVSSSL